MKSPKQEIVEPTLFPSYEGGRPWETKGIFSDHFLRNRLIQSPFWPSDERVKPIYEFISLLWTKRFIGLQKGNEELTRRELLEKVLDRLGFSYFSNLDLPEPERRRTPDYLLFADEQTKDRVFNEEDSIKYESAIALMEAKKIGTPLDKVAQKETPGKFPHQQVKDYLDNAVDKTGRPYFRWAILSNGNTWRLYCKDAHPAAYFEFQLMGQDGYFCSFDDFKLFFTLFQSQVFIVTESECGLDLIREEAIVFQTDLEEDLRKRVFTVLEDLANGFWRYGDNRLKTDDLPTLYEACLIFLYRLLFILYAEGRGLLPVKTSGVGSNKTYRERYSIQRLVPRLKKGTEFQSDTITDLYEENLRLFHLINGDKPSLNKECGVPLYNGGLFNPKIFAALERWRIGEKALARVLSDLVFSSGYTEATEQPAFEWGTIDYADLEVRQLGDIYEGLLGGHLELEGDKLSLRSERGALQESGTFYTPDWVVQFLVKKTLQPLIDRIEESKPVKDATRRRKKDNSFALAVLNLNILDNAMGSGHFLVRATEFLADQVVYHHTTRFEVQDVPLGASQEQAEIAYWRRRVVEACIYGVDLNPLAVELAKLSLWLTCIAVNEPLNFLDHHLRLGNSLVGSRLSELGSLPTADELTQISITFGENLKVVVSDAIMELEAIEEEASSEIEIVKKKEERWRGVVLPQLEPFKRVGDLWIAAGAGLGINDSEYRFLAKGIIEPYKSRSKECRLFKEMLKRVDAELKRITLGLKSFHWELEFPEVFFEDDGSSRKEPGFDAILGNPPYISTQTSSEFDYRDVLGLRFSFTDDLYVHFVFQGFDLLRRSGMFGYIVSDTFFTLSTKERLRELLQDHRLHYLCQCDPFKATVDAAMFVSENCGDESNYPFYFVQARYSSKNSTPQKEIEKLASVPFPLLHLSASQFGVGKAHIPVKHATRGCLRLHQVGIDVYRNSLKRAFFEPSDLIVGLYNRFNGPMKSLVAKWWDKVENSRKYDDNRNEISHYLESIGKEEISLIGLIADGGQGMRTANNGRFLGYVEGSQEANQVLRRQVELSDRWRNDEKVRVRFLKLLEQHDGVFEDVVEPLKIEFDQARDLGLRRGEIYRTVNPNLIVTQEDYLRAYELRKNELKELWRHSKVIGDVFQEYNKKFTDDFCNLFVALTGLAAKRKISLGKVGVHPGEFYSDERDAPRIAAIYNGIPGKRVWVPFRKGDPHGNKWTDIEPLFIAWSPANVSWLSTSADARWQGQHMFFTEGVTYTLLGNHVALKAKLQPACVFDAGASRLTPNPKFVDAYTFLAVLNSNIFSYLVRKFIKNSAAYEINDLRMAPFVMPTPAQSKRLSDLSQHAVEAKSLSLSSKEPSGELVSYCRSVAHRLTDAPIYYRPDPQLQLLDSAEECLQVIELALQVEVEKLFGVSGEGPFEEF